MSGEQNRIPTVSVIHTQHFGSLIDGHFVKVRGTAVFTDCLIDVCGAGLGLYRTLLLHSHTFTNGFAFVCGLVTKYLRQNISI